jgi:hypothetical protein
MHERHRKIRYSCALIGSPLFIAHRFAPPKHPRPTHSISGQGPLPPSAMKRSIRAMTTGSGTEPSSSAQLSPRVTQVPGQMIVKFMHHKRLTMDKLKLRIPHRLPQKFASKVIGQFGGGAAKTGVRSTERESWRRDTRRVPRREARALT